MKYLLMWLVKGYQKVISPLYPPTCRYHPSCSAYAVRAIETHGAISGSFLAARRLLHCHPWADGGYDPVPGTPEAREWEAEQRAMAKEKRLAQTDFSTPQASPEQGKPR